jgi:hypothetical protein
VALGTHGKGHILFFGDVNGEEVTCIILMQLGLLLGGGGDGVSPQGEVKAPLADAAPATAGAGDTICTLPSCTNAAHSRCAGCNEAKYCSRACQKADWKRHKKECKSKKKKKEKPSSGTVGARAAWACGLNSADQYEWLSNCYMMRCDDDYAWGGCNLHGPYDPDATAISNGKDFLVFCLLAAWRGVVPASWDWPAFLGVASQFVCFAFEKSDAQERWGSENVFAAQMGGRSLRHTAMEVYGCGAQEGHSDELSDAMEKARGIKESWAACVVRRGSKASFPTQLSDSMAGVGGLDAWTTFLKGLAAKRYDSRIC